MPQGLLAVKGGTFGNLFTPNYGDWAFTGYDSYRMNYDPGIEQPLSLQWFFSGQDSFRR